MVEGITKWIDTSVRQYVMTYLWVEPLGEMLNVAEEWGRQNIHSVIDNPTQYHHLSTRAAL